MNAVICRKGSDKIIRVITNCYQRGRNLIGENGKILGINPNKFDIYWTEDSTIKLVEEGEQGEYNRTAEGLDREYNRTLDGFIQDPDGVKTDAPSYSEYAAALKLRKLITGMSYSDLENYINTNVTTLASAKVFLIRLSKVVLALSKIVDTHYK